VQTAEEPLRRSRRRRTEMCIRALLWSSEPPRFSTAAASRSFARRGEEDPRDGSQEHPKNGAANQ
jgi:hypothetical protein